MTLFINEIFPSIDGEVNAFHQGHTSIFVRLAGCNLNCDYCDTKYAQKKESGKEMSIKEVIEEIEKFKFNKITITGGEPLLQKESVMELIAALNLHLITIETNGTIAINPWENVDENLSYIVDYKFRPYGIAKNEAFKYLKEKDFIKFVISNSQEYKSMKEVMKYLREISRAKFAVAPAFNVLRPEYLLGWLMRDGIDIIVNFQLHKLLKFK